MHVFQEEDASPAHPPYPRHSEVLNGHKKEVPRKGGPESAVNTALGPLVLQNCVSDPSTPLTLDMRYGEPISVLNFQPDCLGRLSASGS